MPVHWYEATDYRREMGGHEPNLVLSPGDTLVTQCVDAFGVDANGIRVAGGDNPLTGPFSVEGAEPGDTLIVHIHSLVPNRDHGYSEGPVVPNVVDPHYASHLPPRSRAKWHIDVTAGTARLIDPRTDSPCPVVELHPMLGCLGVAPNRGQVIWSGTSGRHGGNMDYRGIVSGATVYLPVSVPGALLYIGDGHAAQGAGEVGGTGIESSMDIELSVDIAKNTAIGWPRGEDEGFIWTIGNARPLEQALQHATTEMLHWLQTGFGYDAFIASILLSQTAEYDVGNVCDPAFTMVCKLPKLPCLKARQTLL